MPAPRRTNRNEGLNTPKLALISMFGPHTYRKIAQGN